jgi:hypothetical protein
VRPSIWSNLSAISNLASNKTTSLKRKLSISNQKKIFKNNWGVKKRHWNRKQKKKKKYQREERERHTHREGGRGREEERARSNTTECGAKDAASDEQANAHAQDHTKRTTISD